ncbi:MAG: D-serine ammonia-lyase [Peptostreptococcaceae bacterium]|nr:D-serine ammonia-lyase [Peptostreptococcaceae bacterium]
MKKVLGKTMDEWTVKHPLLKNIINTKEVFWINPLYGSYEKAFGNINLSMDDIKDASERLKRFAPYLMKAFPETVPSSGIIESPLREIPLMKSALEDFCDTQLNGLLMVKCDSHLPISGSIKARGGIYEVLKHAEDLAIENGLLTKSDNYAVLAEERFKAFFSKYSIAVGSTGNLGLSIGIMSAKLGFRVFVHMSSDAKAWKKDLLRNKGVAVVEYDSDYSLAVKEGRRQSEGDPSMHFVDDENSSTLFLGYSVAALRLAAQFEELGISIDREHPLFVYLPCGVGGGPGGVAFGLKAVFGNAVHCFFAEPTHSPCMLIGMMTGLHERVSVQDFGIDNLTDADGLAVGRPSGFVGKTMENLISGIYTATDERLYRLLGLLGDSEDLWLEPSALAGFPGPCLVESSDEGKAYLKKHGLKAKNILHLPWATGGSMVPAETMKAYYEKSKA